MTRGTIRLFKEEKPFVCLAIQSDMYPNGIMKDIAERYCDYREVDGIQAADRNVYNGISDFAGQLITYLKNSNAEGNDVNDVLKKIGLPIVELNKEAGWLYIESPDFNQADGEYHYEITSIDNKLFVSCRNNEKALFKGTMKDYLIWREEESEG